MGFEAQARRIQQLYLDGHKQEAAAAVPTSMVESIALLGPRDRIRDDLAVWRESIATTLVVSPLTSGGDPTALDTLRTVAELMA